ncbi:hypothetical protein BO70DRAFT_400286 [Aspergillus heteromorphus CBS 117.55]|uniref:FAD/NAD(P)-binding domain-containing protein n=1 Tax=Aspergillus heteromorphus CBS 117.55 TaxID=1448321 RepID=A0A317V3R6_9EURO|nr:uncharacterized protein BO70DRAFT_400286 [Aspergillus heteromorphus CBS 117.55]PWY68666.1 hypothetical protein BO70DRAFT_400286 [Aspergillus heteromorphus CBS 117.55]
MPILLCCVRASFADAFHARISKRLIITASYRRSAYEYAAVSSVVTPDGMRTSDGKLHELDVIIIATGFAAVDGAYATIDIQERRKGESLGDGWKRVGLKSYMGCCVLGPLIGFSNVPPLAETHVDFARDLIRQAEEIAKRKGTVVVV